MAINYAVADPIFQPAMRVITAITNGFTAQVTTSFAHDYLDGMIVRLYVPRDYGMIQADKKMGTITIVDSTNFLIDIDTTYFDAFVVPMSTNVNAQVVPIGEVNNTLQASTLNILPSGNFS